jgi:hypothetical protein
MNGDLKTAVLSDDGAIVIGTKVCPPKEKMCWRLVDSGTHSGNAGQAAKEALQAYQQAFPAMKAAAENDANAFVHGAHCDGDCADNGTMVIGPFQTTQEWDVNIHVEPNTARTWCWVGYLGVLFCKRGG